MTTFLKSLHTKNKIHSKLSYMTKKIISNSSLQFPKGMITNWYFLKKFSDLQ